MSLHQASGHWRRGLLLALTTAACWATLPVALKLTLNELDPFTLTWFRFLLAAGVMAAWLGARGGFDAYRRLGRRSVLLLTVAALGLIGNYLLYLLGVHYTSPANAQLLIQLAPLLMALGGIVVFGERFNRWQWLGLAVIVAGLALFFVEQLQRQPEADAVGGYVLGSLLVLVAAVVWAAYALAQKQLLLKLSSPAILLAIYVAASVVLLPLSAPEHLFRLDGLHWALLLFCALNTLVAYGAFAEALVHWEASRVSAVLALTPMLCLAVAAGVHAYWPEAIAAERIGLAGLAGAALVVLGSGLASLMGQKHDPA